MPSITQTQEAFKFVLGVRVLDSNRLNAVYMPQHLTESIAFQCREVC